MHHFTFILPSKTYVKKFITATYGDPVFVDLKTDIGFVILSTLTSKLEAKVCRGYIDHWQDRYKDELKFKLPIHYFSIAQKEVSPFTHVLINRYFENLFDKELNTYMVRSMAAGSTIKKSIESFLDQFNIDLEIDISYDAIKKAEYRNRKKLSKEFSRTLSPDLFTAERV